jgi:hypothetical protein
MLEHKFCPDCVKIRFDEDGLRNEVPEDFFCKTCDDKGYVNIGEDEIVYVNVYSVTRHYGGPEEGGWWYNWSECIEVFPTKNKNAETIREELESENAYKKFGNIYSVLGGRDIEVRIEETPKESETKERPHYE